MKKLLLLDADVLIDLHSLGLFQRICKFYDVHLAREVLEEAPFYKKQGVDIKSTSVPMSRLSEKAVSGLDMRHTQHFLFKE